MLLQSLSAAVHALVLGPPGQQRLRAAQSLLALVVYLLLVAVNRSLLALGMVEPAAWMGPTALLLLCGASGFFLLIRSGLNERLARRWQVHPALTLPQIGLGVVATAAAYAATGPARGGALSLMMVTVVYGMFALTPLQARRMMLLAVALLLGVMWALSHSDPLRYPPVVELTHFVCAMTVMLVVSALSRRMGALRQQLSDQKSELAVALVQIRQLATRDDLTGLVNRRHMAELVDIERARQRRQPKVNGMCLGLIDIDLFKQINDSFGHAVGDVVLQRFAQNAQQSLRANDVIARWGGEEFLLMLPGTPLEAGLLCVERMRQSLRGVNFGDVAPGLKLSFSAGLTACDAQDMLEASLERADQAMYRAKTQGRNCTVVA